MSRLILIICLISQILLCKISANDIYFMPLESKKLQKNIKHLIESAKKSILISSYYFTNKQISKYLKKSAKNGIIIKIIFDYKNSKTNYSLAYYLAKYKNFKIYIANKQHTIHQNYIIIDKKIVIFGSANLSKSAFKKNFEFMVIENDKYKVNRFIANFSYILNSSTIYE